MEPARSERRPMNLRLSATNVTPPQPIAPGPQCHIGRTQPSTHRPSCAEVLESPSHPSGIASRAPETSGPALSMELAAHSCGRTKAGGARGRGQGVASYGAPQPEAHVRRRCTSSVGRGGSNTVRRYRAIRRPNKFAKKIIPLHLQPRCGRLFHGVDNVLQHDC